MLSHRVFAACGIALAATLAACADSPTGGGNDARLQLRFGVQGGQALASGASSQASGTDQRIDDIRLVVAELELDGDDDVNPCAGDDCEDFDAGPMFVDLPLTGGPVAVGSGDVPPGVYDEVEFEVEDLDDYEENAAERQRIEVLRGQILAQFADWPRDASMLVVGSFTPTGGAAIPRLHLEPAAHRGRGRRGQPGRDAEPRRPLQERQQRAGPLQRGQPHGDRDRAGERLPRPRRQLRLELSERQPRQRRSRLEMEEGPAANAAGPFPSVLSRARGVRPSIRS